LRSYQLFGIYSCKVFIKFDWKLHTDNLEIPQSARIYMESATYCESPE
jgi:hypothetical protein